MLLEDDKADNQNMLLEGILPLAIEAGNLMEIVNKKKKDLDTKDLVDNINKVAVKGNLSPKQNQPLNARHRK